MRADQVQVGRTYRCRVESGIAPVRVDSVHADGGWLVTPVEGGGQEHVLLANQFRGQVVEPAVEPPTQEQMLREAVEADLGHPVQTLSDAPTPHAGRVYDPDCCATPRCKGAVVIDHLGKPLCQRCWEAACEETTTNDGAASAGSNGAASAEKETTMSKKSSTKKTAKAPKATKAAKATPAAEKPKKSAKPTGEAKPKRLSALDAAAQVLKEAGKPMRATEMIVAMAEQGLWSSPNGKTPHATLYAAMLREIGVKGGEARFRKADKGLFAYAGTGA